MHSCQASEQFIVRGNAFQKAQRFESGLPTVIPFLMRGIILAKMSDDETASLEGQCFWISRQYFIDHITEVE